MKHHPAANTEAFWRALTLHAGDQAPDARLREALQGSALDADTRAYLLEQDPNRLLVYRTLVRRTIRGALQVAIPRTIARLEGQFELLFQSYLAHAGPRSRYLRDLTIEFLDHVAEVSARPTTDLPRVPVYLVELGHLEAIEIEVAAAPDDIEGQSASDLDLSRGLRFTRACRLMHFTHAVHRLPAAEDDRTMPAAGATHLLAYRDHAHDVRYLELTPLAASTTRALLGGQSLGETVSGAANEQAEPLSPSLIEGMAAFLTDLAERGIVLGPA